MKQPLQKLKNEAKALKLSTTEKAALHAALMNAMGQAAAPRLTPSPFFFAPQFAGAFAAVMLLLIGGTAYAAKGTVPGDLLYGVKTNINEPIQGALSLSVESKIKFHSEVAQTRLEEAEVLASQNRLDASTTQKLESDIDAHLSQRDELAQTLDEKAPGASAGFVSEFNSSIAAHGEVLAVLGSESKNTSTRDNSDALASHAKFASAAGRAAAVPMMMAKTAPTVPEASPTKGIEATMTLMVAGGSAEDASTSSSSPEDEGKDTRQTERNNSSRHADNSDEQAVLVLEKRATSSLESLTKSANAVRASLKEGVAAKLDARLAEISALMAQGESAMQSGDFGAAKESFSQVLDKSATLSTFISAYARFDNGLLGNLFDRDHEDGE